MPHDEISAKLGIPARSIRPNRRRYLDWLGQHLGLRRPEDWYRLGNRDFLQHHGHGVVKHFGYSIPALLQEYWPEYAWQEWRFASVPDGFWDEPGNQQGES